MIKTLVEGFLLGLSTGSVCLATCTPIYLPWLISEDRNLRKSFGKILEISAGRFISYIIFGALAGYLGSNIKQMNRELFTGISYIFLTIFLLVNSFRTTRHDKKCLVPKWSSFSQSAFMLGLLTGINFCPSFLIALTNSFGLGGVLAGVLLFIGFFVGTTLFLIPLAFTGLLTAMPLLKKIARIASILIAVWFFYKGIVSLNHYYTEQKEIRDKVEIVLNDPSLKVSLVFLKTDSLLVQTLIDSLSEIYAEKPKIIQFDKGKYKVQRSGNEVNLIDSRIEIEGDTLAVHIIRINDLKNPHQILEFIRNYNFKVRKDKGLYWVM